MATRHGYTELQGDNTVVNSSIDENLLKKYSGHHKFSVTSDDDELEFAQIELQEQPNGHIPSERPKASSRCALCYLVTASVMASLGGILFGYDIGIISGAMLQLKDEFCLTCLQEEFIVSSMLIGATVGSLLGGFLIDSIGRRLTIIVNAVIFLIGAVVLTIATDYTVLIIGRLILGFAVSVSACGECIYISEIAPAKKRGLLVSMNELGITLGLLLAYLVNYAFISTPDGWRYMFGISAVPAVIQGIGMFFLPSSPRYLMLKKQEKKAEEVLLKLRGGANVDRELSAIRISIASEKNNNCFHLLSGVDNMRGRMFIGIGLVFFQQFTGQPNVLYYAPTIFEIIGFQTDSAATLATVGLGIVKVIMTCIALVCVDRWGRRKFLIVGATLMGIGILVLGLVTKFQDFLVTPHQCEEILSCQESNNITHSNLSNFTTTNSQTFSIYNVTTNITQPNPAGGITEAQKALVPQIVSLVALMVYVAAFAFSFGPVTWLVLSEIFPAAVKGRAIAFATVFNWGTNLVVSFSFLDVMNDVGISNTFIGFSVICALSISFIFFFVPETKNRSLEQVSSDLKKRSTLLRLKEVCKKSFCRCCKGEEIHVHDNYSRLATQTSAETECDTLHIS